MKELYYEIPCEIKRLSIHENDYVTRVKRYFRLVHPHLILVRVLGKRAFFVKRDY